MSATGVTLGCLAAFAVGVVVALAAVGLRHRMGRNPLARMLRRHFKRLAPEQVATDQREYPFRMAADAYPALASWLQRHGGQQLRAVGVPVMHPFMTELGIGTLLAPAESEETHCASAVEYDAFDVGEDAPRRCPKHALWLFPVRDTAVAVLWTSRLEHTGEGVMQRLRIEIATATAELTQQLSAELFAAIDDATQRATAFRGKVLSFEQTSTEGGQLGVTFHRLRSVERDDVVLPRETIRLLERNVLRFVEQQPALRAAGMPTKKGLLFYGPPGTGKTHTIHYLVGALPHHTTLLITAEQVGLLTEYLQMARLLQPAIVVMEDVDLVARDRGSSSVCEQSVLNRLLNEMDGLREDADVLFFLTTNRAEALEDALASRPGRIDQAIEFPLPHDEGRRKLLGLYSQSTEVSDEVLDNLVARTEGVTASFIKELMRRAIQFHLECRRGDEPVSLSQNDVDQALDEMLFAGGPLTRRLLGGAVDSD
ncbi:MAG: AAA family ATPase [Planctomycetota bacterium]